MTAIQALQELVDWIDDDACDPRKGVQVYQQARTVLAEARHETDEEAKKVSPSMEHHAG